MMQSTFSIDFWPLRSAFSTIEADVQEGVRNGAIQSGFANAQRAYLKDMQDRFPTEGDGTWRELAPLTQQERFELGFEPAHPILKRLGILEAALTPGAPGNIFDVTDDAFTAGIGGSDLHPGYVSPKTGKVIGGDTSIGEIAYFHQEGGGLIPRRLILIPPWGSTLEKMQNAVTAGVRNLIDRAVEGANEL